MYLLYSEYMLVIEVGKKENIEKALKRYKYKVVKTKQLIHIKENTYYEKPTTKKRKQKLKAIYNNKKKGS